MPLTLAYPMVKYSIILTDTGNFIRGNPDIAWGGRFQRPTASGVFEVVPLLFA